MEKLKRFKNFNINESESFEFNHLGEDFKLNHIHTNSYRLIDKKTNTWSIVKGADMQDAQSNAMQLIDDVFADGRPNFYPNKGEKFVVTGEHFDSDTNTTKKTDKISFRQGTHWQNPGGTGSVHAKRGDVITFDREGEDNGFWYLDGDKRVDPKYYFKYTDGSPRYSVKGSKPWHLLWSKQIRMK